jgi:hypothetical protein
LKIPKKGGFLKGGADEKISHTTKPFYKTPIKSIITTECATKSATISATCFIGEIILI